MKITFLGTGGGRFSAISQRRMTGVSELII